MIPTSCLNILFIDIETVPMASAYDKLDADIKRLWSRKAKYLRKHESDTDEKLFNSSAGIYAEFGKIIVIGVGNYFYDSNRTLHFRQKVFFGDEEKFILQDFCQFLQSKEISDKYSVLSNVKILGLIY